MNTCTSAQISNIKDIVSELLKTFKDVKESRVEGIKGFLLDNKVTSFTNEEKSYLASNLKALSTSIKQNEKTYKNADFAVLAEDLLAVSLSLVHNTADNSVKVEKIVTIDTDETGVIQTTNESSVTLEGIIDPIDIGYTSNEDYVTDTISVVDYDLDKEKTTLINEIGRTRFANSADLHIDFFNQFSSELFGTVFVDFNEGTFLDPSLGTDAVNLAIENYKAKKTNQVISLYNALTEVENSPFINNEKLAGEGSLSRIQEAINEATLEPRFLKNNPQLATFYNNFLIAKDFDTMLSAYEFTNALIEKDNEGRYRLINETKIREGANLSDSLPSAISTSTQLLRNLIQNISLSNGTTVHFNTFSRLVATHIPSIRGNNYQNEVATRLKEAIKKTTRKVEGETLQKVYDRFYNPDNPKSLVNIVEDYPKAQNVLTTITQYISSMAAPDLHVTKGLGKGKLRTSSIISKSQGTKQKIQNSFVNKLASFGEGLSLQPDVTIETTPGNKGIVYTQPSGKITLKADPSGADLAEGDLRDSLIRANKKLFTILTGHDIDNSDYDELFDLTKNAGRLNAIALQKANAQSLAFIKAYNDLKGKKPATDPELFADTLAMLKTFWGKAITQENVVDISNFNDVRVAQKVIDRFAISIGSPNVNTLIEGISNIVDDLALNSEKVTTTGVANVQKPKLTQHSTVDSFEEKIEMLRDLEETDVNYHNIFNQNWSKQRSEGLVKVSRAEGVDVRNQKVENERLNELDNFYNQIASDYYGNLIPAEGKTQGLSPYYSPIVYADKGVTRSFIIPQEVVTDPSLGLDGQIQETLKRHYLQGKGRYTALQNRIVQDYNTALGSTFATADDIDTYLQSRYIQLENTSKTPLRDLKFELSQKFFAEGLEFTENIHINERLSEIGTTSRLSAKFNPTLKAKINLYVNGEFEAFKSAMQAKVKKEASLLSSKKLPEFVYEYATYRPSTSTEFNSYVKSFNETTISGEYPRTDVLISRGERVNPLFEKFFYEFSLVQDATSWLLHGDTAQYKGSSLNQRFIEQTKRAGNAASTGIRFQLGLNNGLEDNQNLAVVDDLKTRWEGFLGQNVGFDEFDGSMLMAAISARQHANSLGGELGVDAGTDFKTVGNSKNDSLGVNALRKWLAFTISNEVIRNNPRMEEQSAKMMSNRIVGKKLKPHRNYSTKVYDVETGEIKTVDIGPNDEFDTIYDLWKALGGAYTLKPDNNGLIEDGDTRYSYTDFKTTPITDSAGNLLDASDITNEILAQDKADTLARNAETGGTEKYFKQVMIDGVTMASGIKTGAANVNRVEDFHNPDAKYMTQSFSNKDYILAITLKKSYEKQAGRETVKSTQLIGALSLGGNTHELSKHAYDVLKLATEYSIKKDLQQLFRKENWNEDDLTQILEITKEKLTTDLANRDSLSLATEIVRALPKNVNYDSGQITSILTTALNSFLTKDGIKQKTAGGQMLIKPPIIPLYEVVNEDGDKRTMMLEAAQRFVKNNKGYKVVDAPRKLKSADTLVSMDVINTYFDLTDDQINYYSEEGVRDANQLVSVYDLHTTDRLKDIYKRVEELSKKKQLSAEEQTELDNLIVERKQLNRINEKFARYLESEKETLSNYEAFKSGILLYKIIPGEVMMSPVHAAKFNLFKGTQPQEVTVETFLEKAGSIHGKLQDRIEKLVNKTIVTDEEIDNLDNVVVYNSLADREELLGGMTEQEWSSQNNNPFFKKKLDELKAIENHLDSFDLYDKFNLITKEEINNKLKQEIANGTSGNYNSFTQVKRRVDNRISESIGRLIDNRNKLAEKIRKHSGRYEDFVYETAEELYKNFQLSNRVTNMRIPLQSFASVMHNNVVGYLWDMNNVIMINDKHQALTGGDFDADKSNSELLDFSKNGMLIKWKTDLDVMRENTWLTDVSQLEEDLKNEDVTVKGALNYVNYLTSIMASSPANLNARETEVSLDNITSVANNTAKGKDSANLTSNSIASVVRIRNANMVAQDAIGIFATAIKSLSVIHNATHSALKEIEGINQELATDMLATYRTGLEKQKEDLINRITFNLPFQGEEYRMTGSLNLDYISEGAVSDLLTKVYEEDLNVQSLAERLAIEGYDNEQVLDKVVEYIRFELETQVKNYDQLGQLLNAAVDNAKELALEKINADAQTSSIYGVATVVGIPIKNVADLLTSPEIESVIKMSQKSPFGGAFKSMTGIIQARLELQPNNQNLKDMLTMIQAGEEFKVLGQTLGVNAGLPTTAFGIYNYRARLEDFLNSRLGSAGDVRFSLPEFVNALYHGNNPEYVEEVINNYDVVKSVSNIPWLFSQNPHYIQQLKLLIDSKTWADSISYKIRKADDLISTLSINSFIDAGKLDEGKYKSILRMMDEMTIHSYYKDIKPEFKVNFRTTTDGNERMINKIDLSTAQGKEDYINWMHTLIPIIKDKLKTNSFIKELVYGLSKRDNFGQKSMQYRMVFNPLEQKTDGQKLKLEKAREDFNNLGTFTVGNNKYDLQELFVHYNRIMNKEQLSSDSLSNILHDNKHVKAFWIYQANKRDTFDLHNYIGPIEDINLDVLTYLTAQYGLAPRKGDFKLISARASDGTLKPYHKGKEGFISKIGKVYDFDNPSKNLMYIDSKGKVITEEEVEAETIDTTYEEVPDKAPLQLGSTSSAINLGEVYSIDEMVQKLSALGLNSSNIISVLESQTLTEEEISEVIERNCKK